jgi:hypothetical protein
LAALKSQHLEPIATHLSKEKEDQLREVFGIAAHPQAGKV